MTDPTPRTADPEAVLAILRSDDIDPEVDLCPVCASLGLPIRYTRPEGNPLLKEES